MSVVLPVLDDTPQQRNAALDPVAAVPEQVRVAIHVGTWLVETSLVAHAPLSVVMEGLTRFLATTLADEGLSVQFNPTGVYSLAPEGGMPFSRSQALAELGVLDGDRLILREVHSTEVFKPLIEDGPDALAEFNAVRFPSFTAATARALALTALVAFALLLATLTVLAWWSNSTVQWWLAPVAAPALLAVVGAAVAQRRATALSYVLGISALPLAFAAGWVAVPPVDGANGAWTAANPTVASVAAGVVSLLVVRLTGIGITVHTAAVTGAGIAAVAAALLTFTGFDGRQVGTGAVVIGMIVIVGAPALSLLRAKVRPPSLPVPGEDIDRAELEEAALEVEVFDDADNVRSVALSDDEDRQLERRSRIANKYLTGLFIAAAVTLVVGAVAALRPGTHYFYGELALALLAVLIMLLRGRSLPDRLHSVVFFSGAFALTAGVAVVVVVGVHTPGAQLGVLAAVAAAGVLAVLAGLLLPGAKMSPITLRRIEQLEFVAILAVAPLAFWIVGAYAALRNGLW
ncbi:type VII secretion integral membrane protein EccD [Mycolicibacterium sp. XJ870]